MSEEEKVEIMREIVNLLANNKATVQEADEILHGVRLSIENTTIIQRIN